MELPKKPKPFRVQFLLMSALFGWPMTRDKIIRKFDLCKDIEYTCILHILDEVVPLAFFHHAAFLGGNLQMYSGTTFRFLLLFIVWERRHNDKFTLSMLRDLIHQKWKTTSQSKLYHPSFSTRNQYFRWKEWCSKCLILISNNTHIEDWRQASKHDCILIFNF